MRYLSALAFSSVIVAAPALLAAESARIEIYISAKGTIGWGGQTVSIDELASHLAKASTHEKKPEVLIIADENAPIDAVNSVMLVCRKSGFTKFSLQSR